MLCLLATFLLSLGSAALAQCATPSTADRCAALKQSLSLQNTTILDATHVAAGSNITTPGSCQSSALSTVAVCRVQAVVNTTATSAVHFEAWLPDQWFGRFLGVGNGGLGGCIDYENVDYGATLHFATVGSDNGHDGNSGSVFLNQPEVINDFAFRAIHVEAVVGKQIVDAYYPRPHSKSYYLGCSTGGRQGFQSALRFPDEFDGILAGSPAADFNHLTGWPVMLARFLGAPHANTSASFIPAALWPTISQEILRQCDGLDGVHDGIITEPNDCAFRPETLLCTKVKKTGCLSTQQVTALRNIYAPIRGTKGELLYSRLDPGAENDGGFQVLLTGNVLDVAGDWLKFAVFNDSSLDFSNFGPKDMEIADAINPGGIRTFNGDLSAYRKRGGKLITYHGRRDQVISSGISQRLYNLTRSTLSLPTLDDFYRLFLVPGMDHCFDGPGAWAMGQKGVTSNARNDSAHNALLALVDWVEGGRAPPTMVGTNPATGAVRTHCRFPERSVSTAGTWVCQ